MLQSHRCPPAPPISLDLDNHTSCTDCCQATGGVARRPVARRWAGGPPPTSTSPFPNIHPRACCAGGRCRQSRLGSHHCLALMSPSWGPPRPPPTQLRVRHRPWDPQCLTLTMGAPSAGLITLLCQGGVHRPWGPSTPCHGGQHPCSPPISSPGECWCREGGSGTAPSLPTSLASHSSVLC